MRSGMDGLGTDSVCAAQKNNQVNGILLGLG